MKQAINQPGFLLLAALAIVSASIVMPKFIIKLVETLDADKVKVVYKKVYVGKSGNVYSLSPADQKIIDEPAAPPAPVPQKFSEPKKVDCDYWQPGHTYVVTVFDRTEDFDPFGDNTSRIYIHDRRGNHVQYSYVYVTMGRADSKHTFRCDIENYNVMEVVE